MYLSVIVINLDGKKKEGEAIPSLCAGERVGVLGELKNIIHPQGAVGLVYPTCSDSPKNPETATPWCPPFSLPPQRQQHTDKLPPALSPLIQSVCVISPLTHCASVCPAHGPLSIFILSWYENVMTLCRVWTLCVFVFQVQNTHCHPLNGIG